MRVVLQRSKTNDRCLPPRRHLPAPHGDVAIDRVQLHRAAAPPGAFRGDQLGA